MRFRLPFRRSSIARWAARFPGDGDGRVEAIGADARRQGFLTREQFLALAEWKTPRSRPRCERNRKEFVEAATLAAFHSKSERFKVEALRLLGGVDWPTASVILHFCDEMPYPILDVRVLWSLGFRKPPAYNCDFWIAYVEFMRKVAGAAGVSMRTLDRALWQYSKEKQGGA